MLCFYDSVQRVLPPTLTSANCLTVYGLSFIDSDGFRTLYTANANRSTHRLLTSFTPNVIVSKYVAGFPPALTVHIALHSGVMFRAEKPSGFSPHTAYYVGLDT